jgi:hypothetical protein
MLDSEKLAIAAHLHVALRRKLGRVTDVEWMVRSEEYAREIIRIALAEPAQPELHQLARRMQDALFAQGPAGGSARRPVPPFAKSAAPAAPAEPEQTAAPAEPRRYIGRLR